MTWVVAVALVMLALNCMNAPALGSGGAGKLRVAVAQLPPGAVADITLQGPHGFVRHLDRAALISSVPAGLYRVIVSAGRFVHAYRGVPAGSTLFPTHRALRVRVRPNRTTTAQVRYGTVRSARVVVLTATPLTVRGPSTRPSGILLPAGAAVHLHRGSIVDQAPTAKLPAGLFDRVVRVQRLHRGTLLSLAPALLTEAFPALEIDTTVPLRFGRPPAHAASAADFLSQVDLSYSVPLIPDRLEASCGAPPTGWSVKPSGSLHTALNANVHRGFLGLVYGELSVTAQGSLGVNATIPSQAHCGFTVDGPKGWTVIPIFDVPVPVEAAADLNITLSLDGAAQVSASAGATVTAGAELHGAYATPLLRTGNRTASGSVTGHGIKLTVGPEIQAGIGSNDINAHLDGSFFVAAKGSGSGCELDVGASAGIGFDLGPLHASYTPFEPELPIYRCPQLAISQSGPPGAFPGQAFEYTARVTNTGGSTADGVEVHEALPGEGSFVSSSPAAAASPPAGGTLSLPVGQLAPGQTSTVKIRWRAPTSPTSLVGSATATASNAAAAGPATTRVSVGTTGNCNPCGAVSAGMGLRNRPRGTLAIAGIPPGATVTQAVLVWGILYSGEVPSDAIGFDGHHVVANLTSHVSGDLCWGDTATIGYAADVTEYVSGNGSFEVTEPPNGEIRVDEDPYGLLPYTDGASLIVFYDGGGADNQVLSDFSYNTNTDPQTEDAITRSFTGVNSVGGPASLTLAGPDGQNNFGKTFEFFGAGEFSVENPFEGLSPEEGPNLTVGNLWDDQTFDVTSILPPGQQALTFTNHRTEDCIGVGAAVLQVAQ